MSEIRKKKSDLALEDWLRGLTLREIAEKHGVTDATAKTWHARGKWAKKRKDFKSKVEKSMFSRLLKRIEKNADKYLASSQIVAEMALTAIKEIHKEGKSTGNFRVFADELQQWLSILSRGSAIHKNVVPDANDQLANQILEELRQLRGEQ